MEGKGQRRKGEREERTERMGEDEDDDSWEAEDGTKGDEDGDAIMTKGSLILHSCKHAPSL